MKKLLFVLFALIFINSCASNKTKNNYEDIKTFRDNIKTDVSGYEFLYFESLTKMNKQKIEAYSKNCDCMVYTIGSTDGVVGDSIQKNMSKITPSSGMRIAADTLIKINNSNRYKNFIIVVPTNFWYFEGTLKAIQIKNGNLKNLKGYVWLMTEEKQEKIEELINILSDGNLKVKYGINFE